MTKTGGEQIIETLNKRGAQYVFGYSGGAALPLFDALKTTENTMELVMSRHEQGATHMADGYARVSGKPGIVLVTSGPGATNTFTGLMTAHMDNIPLLAITGQVPTHALGTDAFQETNTTGMSRHITKMSHLVKTGENMADITDAAYAITQHNRPGVALIDIPKDLSGAASPDGTRAATSRVKRKIDDDTITLIAQQWRRAKRPIILAGHGVLIAGASDILTRLATQEATPVTTTLLGKGVFSETNSLSLGMLGMHGTAYANHAILEADFALVIGSRFDDRIVGKPDEFFKNAFVAHIDIDKKEIGKVIQPNASIHGDAHDALTALEVKLSTSLPPTRTSWQQRIKTLKKQFPLHYDDTSLSMQMVIDAVHIKTRGDAIVTTDVGQHQMWAAQFWKTIRPDTWVSSGGAGTMGFGFPAAIGAQLAKPQETVIAFVGDGGFQMTLNELSTAVRYQLPLKIFILDNAYLGMVRQWQEKFYDNRESAVDMIDNPDFVAIARAYGAEGILIDDTKNLKQGIDAAFAINDKPTIIHVKVNRADNVYPFIPAGAPYTTMQVGPSDVKLAAPTGST